VRAPLVRRLAVGHGADDGDLVGDRGGAGEFLVELHAGQLRADRRHVAAVFDRRERLGIKGLLLRPPAGQPDVDHALRRAGEVVERLRLAAGRPEPEQGVERQAEPGDRADVEKFPSAGAEHSIPPRTTARRARHR